METNILKNVGNMLNRLRTTLVTEAEFEGVINKAINDLALIGLQIQITVEENTTPFVEYGQATSLRQTETETLEVAPFTIRFLGGPSKGVRLQDIGLAKEIWEKSIAIFKHTFVEHWRGRNAPSGLWRAEDTSVSEKRQHTVALAAGKNCPIAYVRLDCDGFGALKERLGGDQKPSEVLRKASRFFKEKLSSSCLVFHPHGDEFVLLLINLRPRHVISQLTDFQKAFIAEDFRPSGHDTPLRFGIRMVVSFWLEGRNLNDADRAYDILRNEAEKIDIKNRNDRGFIEIAQSNTLADGPISSQAIQESVLWARQGLATSETSIFKNDLHDLITDNLVHHPDETSLSQYLEELGKRFVLRIFQASEQCALLSTAKVTANRDIPLTRLAAMMLHAILKRRFCGFGPALEKGKLRVVISDATDSNSKTLAIQQLQTGGWKTLFSYGSITSSNAISVEAGEPWLRQQDDPNGTKQFLTRWIPEHTLQESLSPCLAVLAGAKSLKLQPSVALWAAEVVYIDDRPVISGHLPDFWQRNLARIVVDCLRNPNIRSIILIKEDQKAVKETIQNLAGACTQASSGENLTDSPPPWDNDLMGVISSATTISHMQLVHFRERKIRLQVIDANEDAVLKAAYECFQADVQHLRALGSPDLISWRSDEPNDAPGPGYEFRYSKLSEAYPLVLRALRHKVCPRYMEPRGEKIAELTSVHVHIANPSADDLPEYWGKSLKDFKDYYQRAFVAPDSLFGRRFYSWGGKEGQPGADQIEAAIHQTVTAIKKGEVSRRIILATPEPPGTMESDPLGLTAVFVFPRFRGEPKSWCVDFIWVWRSVEAIVGFPFSAHGSVRFSNEFVNKVKARIGSQDSNIRMGEITYIAISMHLYCDPADLAIARHIDLEARP